MPAPSFPTPYAPLTRTGNPLTMRRRHFPRYFKNTAPNPHIQSNAAFSIPTPFTPYPSHSPPPQKKKKEKILELKTLPNSSDKIISVSSSSASHRKACPNWKSYPTFHGRPTLILHTPSPYTQKAYPNWKPCRIPQRTPIPPSHRPHPHTQTSTQLENLG